MVNSDLVADLERDTLAAEIGLSIKEMQSGNLWAQMGFLLILKRNLQTSIVGFHGILGINISASVLPVSLRQMVITVT